MVLMPLFYRFFFQAEDGIRDGRVTGVQTCALPISEAGHVELDGIDLRDLSLAQLRRMVTVMFQLPVSYQGTARHNIAMGDLAAEPDLSRIEAAARDAGAHTVIAALPKGYDTLLGKWFAEGTE